MVLDNLPLSDFIKAFEAGITDKYDLIDYLEITEKFLLEAIDIYKKHYGLSVEIDDYVIGFEPLTVFKWM